MHDIWEATAEAAKTIIPELTARGYKLCTVSELARAYGYDLEAGVPYYSFYPEDSPSAQSEGSAESGESSAEDGGGESSEESSEEPSEGEG